MKTLILVLLSFTLCAQTQVARPLGTTAAKYGYLEYIAAPETLPLIISLHGVGSEGNGKEDLYRIASTGMAKLINSGKFKEKFVVLSPQSGSKFFNPTTLESFIKYAKTTYNIDTGRVYLVGLSGGAISIWNYLAKYKNITAAIPCAGNGNAVVGNGSVPANCSFSHIPIWAFHGDADNTVNVGGSINPVKKINSQCAPPVPYKVTIYQGVGHDSWTRTYDLSGMKNYSPNYDPYNISIYDWLRQFDRTSDVPLPPKPGIYIDGQFAGADSVYYCNSLITIVPEK